MKTLVYLAGKIDKNDWRHDLVTGLRTHTWNDGPMKTDSFIYVGPFFVSCDHGCRHNPNSHGVVLTNEQLCADKGYTKCDVIRLNMEALEKASLVFAYITAPDCYGTIMEIGWAIAKGKRVVMAFAPDVNTEEFWFSSEQCAHVYRRVMPTYLKHILAAEVYCTAVVVRSGERNKP